VNVGRKDTESDMLLLLSHYGFETELASLEVKLETRIVKGKKYAGNTNTERSFD
jgi:hypothetical protein